MLKNKIKTEEEKITEARIRTITYFLILIICVILLSLSKQNNQDKTLNNKEKEFQLINENDRKILDDFTYKIKDNYTIKIKKYNDKNNYILLKYEKDSKIQLYSGSCIDGIEYMNYNNKIYTFEDEMIVRTDKIKYKDEIKEIYYDMDFYMNIIRQSKCYYKSNKNLICKINVLDFVNSYNEKFNTDFKTDSTNEFEIEINNFRYINKIKFNYNDISKILFNKEDISKYEIEIISIGKNDFSQRIEILKRLNID